MTWSCSTHAAQQRIADAPCTAPWETPIDRAHRLCESCELESDDIDRLIGIMRESPEDRETLTRLWEQTYDDPEDLERARQLCGPCIDAILDAAGSPGS